MGLFSLLIVKLIPLYVLMGLGFMAGRFLRVDRESIARIVIYILVPIIMFSGVLKAGVTPETMAVPFVTFSLASVIALLVFHSTKLFYRDATPNLLALAAGTGNTGYFGLPVAMALFNDRTVGIYILGVLGITIFESTLGFYLAARGKHSAREAFGKLLKLPTIYAFLIGVLVVITRLPLPDILWEFIATVRGAYTMLGMMIIGLGIAAMAKFTVDIRFTTVAFAARFVLWPALTLALSAWDGLAFQWLGTEVWRALILLSLVPLAANAVVFATLLGIHPEKTASAVLVSTLFAAIYIPVMCALLLG